MSNINFQHPKFKFLTKNLDKIDNLELESGIESFRKKQISSLSIKIPLIVGTLTETTNIKRNPRIKFSHDLNHLQWAECNCKENRMKGLFCRHLVALTLEITRKNPNLLKEAALNKLGLKPANKNVSAQILPKNQDSNSTSPVVLIDIDETLGPVAIKAVRIATYRPKNQRVETLPYHTIVCQNFEGHDRAEIIKWSDFVGRVEADKTVASEKNQPINQVGQSFYSKEWLSMANSCPVHPVEYLHLKKTGHLNKFAPLSIYFSKAAVETSTEKVTLAGFNISNNDEALVHIENIALTDSKGRIEGKRTAALLSQVKESKYVFLNGVVYILSSALFQLVKSIKKKHHQAAAHLIRASFHEISSLSFEGSTQQVKRFLSRIDPKFSIPPSIEGFNYTLKDYQKLGYKWLYWLYQNRLGGILADEMGLGKTVQVCSLIYGVTSKSTSTQRTLIICPKAVAQHWLNHTRNSLNSADIHLFHGSNKSESNISNADCVITTYGLISKHLSLFSKLTWDILVLDEAHLIKNARTSYFKACAQLNAKTKIALTGTPVENTIMDLTTLFSFILPDYLSPKMISDALAREKRQLESPDLHTSGSKIDAKYEGPTESLDLELATTPFILRRTKKEIEISLPSKQQTKHFLDMSNDQILAYNMLLQERPRLTRSQMLTSPNHTPSVINILALIQKLKQACCHPALVSASASSSELSPKMLKTLKIVQDATSRGKKIVIFSQYLKMIDLLSTMFKREGINTVTYTGKKSNRDLIVEKFQKDSGCKVFIGSLLAGGMGINLTGGSVVVHYDRWWNASKEMQASDRVHRIGQVEPVTIHKLVMKNTIEEKIDKLISSKEGISSNLIDSHRKLINMLLKSDLNELFSKVG